MKNLIYLSISLFFLISCNTDDNNPEPVTEPVVANAKVKFAGDCTLNHYFVELYDPDTSIIPPEELPTDLFSFFNLPPEFQFNDLEIYIEYRNPLPEESPICFTVGLNRYGLHATLVEFPTAE